MDCVLTHLENSTDNIFEQQKWEIQIFIKISWFLNISKSFKKDRKKDLNIDDQERPLF